MVSQQLRDRLSSLRRGQVQPASGHTARSRPAPRGHSELSRCFPEGAVRNTPRGQLFVCEFSLRQVHSHADRLVAAYVDSFRKAAARAGDDTFPPHLEALTRVLPEDAALIDTETAGFHGRPLFLAGLARYRHPDLIITQYFARDYAEEAALLGELAALLPDLRLLISFNGKAFDWPFIKDRMVYHRISCQTDFAHADLLHPSRRRWRARLPNCKLQTLERYLSGRWRSGDIPSAEIPQRYHDFVRAQDARLIAPIFHHNRLDLITMVELLAALVGESDPTRLDPPPVGEGST